MRNHPITVNLSHVVVLCCSITGCLKLKGSRVELAAEGEFSAGKRASPDLCFFRQLICALCDEEIGNGAELYSLGDSGWGFVP